MTGGASSFVSETTRLVSQANSTLAGIKDPASAEAAAPRLQEINQQMTNLRSTWNQLPASARSTASSTLQPQIAKLKQTAQNILSQPGIGQTVRPQVEQLMANLNAFSTQ
jgi:F0F1-type ATP synthase membrane subunit b/b'